MTREQIASEIDFVDSVMQSHFNDYGEETHRALQEAVKLIEEEPKTDGDCISRQATSEAVRRIGLCKCNTNEIEAVDECLRAVEDLPSVNPQEPKTKALGEELRSVRNGITDEKLLIGYNMAVAICNKYLEVSE